MPKKSKAKHPITSRAPLIELPDDIPNFWKTMFKKSKTKQPLPRRALLLVELPDDIIGSIATFAGPCALYEMFGIGNRLLTRKLSSPAAIPYYSNVNEYGSASYFSLSFLKLFRGLKSVVLDLSDFPSSRDYSLVSILSVLPEGLQGIDLRRVALLDNEDNRRSCPDVNVGPVLLRSKLEFRFPLLQRFLLTSTHEKTWDWNFAEVVNLLPPNLTDLGLMNIDTSHEHACQPLKLLQTLTFTAGRLYGLSWILNDLPNLTSLKASGVATWELSEDDFSAELEVMRHQSLKRLACSELLEVKSDYFRRHPISHIRYLEVYLLDHFPFLEYLELPIMKNCTHKFKDFLHLKYCFASSLILKDIFPSSLTVLRLQVNHFIPSLFLPRHLTILEMNCNPADYSLLPRSLTELWLPSATVPAEEVPNLPPHLTVLVGIRGPIFGLLWQKLPAYLQYISDCKEVYVKTPQRNLSLQKSGWTNFQKAAETCDFESLETILHFLRKVSQMAEIRIRTYFKSDPYLVDDDCGNISLECYDWFRKIGLLSNPHFVGEIFTKYCWKVILQRLVLGKKDGRRMFGPGDHRCGSAGITSSLRDCLASSAGSH